MGLLNIAFYMEQADKLNRKALRQVDEWEQISAESSRGEYSARLQVDALVAALKITYGKEILLLRLSRFTSTWTKRLT